MAFDPSRPLALAIPSTALSFALKRSLQTLQYIQFAKAKKLILTVCRDPIA